jgi:nitric oxide reductase large subunit
MSEPERTYWLDDRRNVNKVIYALCTVCAAFMAADLFGYKHHLHFGFEYWFGFYGLFGFIACVGLVLAAKVLRKLVMRDEDYYD